MSLPHAPRAVVTGAASGLGRAFCLELAKRKGRVVCADLDLAGAERTADDVRKEGGEAVAAACDVAKPEDFEALAALADERFGGVDLVVNNAGVAVAGPFSEIALEHWKWIVDVNLWGVVHGCRTFVPRFQRQGSGAVINVASAAGLLCAPEMAPYNVTKAAVVGLSETLHAELAAQGIAVTVLCPTFFRTNIGKNGRGPRQEEMAGLTEKLMDRSSWSANDVARAALDGCDRGRLYVVPMADGKWAWRAKRADPERFYGTFMPRAFARMKPKVGG